jgi:hypothetical protein
MIFVKSETYEIIYLGFPIWFLAHDPRGPFRDFLPVPQFYKNFFPVRSGYSLAQGCFDALFLFLLSADSDSLEALCLKSVKIKPNRRAF